MGTLRIISSMATRLVLNELAESFQQKTGALVSIESVGGVDVARRVQAGETFDVVILASDALDNLIVSGRVIRGSKVNLVRSGVAVIVRKDALVPDISSEDALRKAILSSKSISYSTGPSGVALATLFERWGIAEAIQDRIVKPAPGTPVGMIVASGQAELGFQQLSEVLHVEGIAILGAMPPAVQIVTTFAGGVCTSSTAPDSAKAFLDFLASTSATEAKLRQGMEPA
ncbi:MAG: molybdenum ABC transporter substrate-binding protein [Spirochaetae bacterium HGW-Spirochaetae-9]|nr:MAG: molybdenum ABC transporter substrate-binding protein [Spirochaetae bacterium HGW-Spirochaetae-9]